MTEKLRSTSIFALIFYSLIFLHNIVYQHFNDPEFLVQMLFFIAFSFSTAFFEGALKSNSKRVKWLATIEFSLRSLVLISHLFYLFFDLNFVISLISTGVLFMLNLGVYFFILKSLNLIEFKEEPVKLPQEVNAEKLRSLISISGMQTLIGLILICLLPFLNLVYKYQKMTLILFVVLMISTFKVYIVKLHFQLSEAIPGRSKFKCKLEIAGIVIGFMIIIASQVLLYHTNDLLRPTIMYIGILCWVPAILFKLQLARLQKTILNER